MGIFLRKPAIRVRGHRIAATIAFAARLGSDVDSSHDGQPCITAMAFAICGNGTVHRYGPGLSKVQLEVVVRPAINSGRVRGGQRRWEKVCCQLCLVARRKEIGR